MGGFHTLLLFLEECLVEGIELARVTDGSQRGHYRSLTSKC